MSTGTNDLPLPRAFYARDPVVVAQALLGQRLVRVLNDRRLSGLICETEAYAGADDPASHAYRRTQRSAIMYGPPGVAYVYFIYGMHHCLNAVTACDGTPGAVLIRGIIPAEGSDLMRDRRGGAADKGLANGPGKLCQALGISLAQNGSDLTEDTALFITAGPEAAAREITATPRIGVRGDEEARARPWRFVWRPVQSLHKPAV
jgi:DNA-3-methyladenine glycosylase